MMIFLARPYNQRLTTLNTHQWPTPVQRSNHSYAQKSFGEAATAKYVHFFAQTPYVGRMYDPGGHRLDAQRARCGWK